MKKLMIYGATGYTGRMAAQRASAAGTPLILAGRSEAALVTLAASLDADYRVFPFEDMTEIDRISQDQSSCGRFDRTDRGGSRTGLTGHARWRRHTH